MHFETKVCRALSSSLLFETAFNESWRRDKNAENDAETSTIGYEEVSIGR